MGLYITYSRGALAAAATGLLVLLALAPSRPQLRTGAIAVAAAGLGAAAAAPFPAVASLGHGSRTSQGAASLALLLVLAAAAGLVQARFARLEADGRLSTAPVRLRGLRTAAVVGACAVIALFVAATSAGERRSASRTAATGAVPSRLTSFRSHRYAYWNVALGAFADHPLDGLGSGNFSVRWLRKRHFREAVMDAHSLYLETAAELGLPGLLALAALFAGVVLAARDVMRSDAVLGAGLAAGSAAWAAQAGVDWLWEMPAVTLIALTLAAGLLASAEAGARPEPPG
jgi:O-antigen ligase